MFNLYFRWTRNNTNASLNGFSLSSNTNSLGKRVDDLATQIFGTPQCPRMNEVPIMEPIVLKKISRERLTALQFQHDGIVTACQDAYICTYARPGVCVYIFMVFLKKFLERKIRKTIKAINNE